MDEYAPWMESVALTDDGEPLEYVIRAAIVAAGDRPRVIVRLPKAAVLIKIWETDKMMFAMVAPPSTPTEAFDAAYDGVYGDSYVNVREGLAKVPGSAILYGHNHYEQTAQLYGNADEFGSVAGAVLRAWLSFSGEYDEAIPKMMCSLIYV